MNKKRIKREINSVFYPRVKCSCGWYNYEFSKWGKRIKRCVNCGAILDKSERKKVIFKKKIRKKMEEIC